MNQTLRAWRASFTRRWHTNPDLCDTTDYVAGHQCRVALLILSLFPDASRALLCRALTHDQGEVAAGDMPHNAKTKYPEIGVAVALVEAQEIGAQGFAWPELAQDEQHILKLCDHLDAWLWMMRHARHLARRDDWAARRQQLVVDSVLLSVRDQVLALIVAEEARA